MTNRFCIVSLMVCALVSYNLSAMELPKCNPEVSVLCQALHQRLGVNSPARLLTQYLCQEVADYVPQEVSFKLDATKYLNELLRGLGGIKCQVLVSLYDLLKSERIMEIALTSGEPCKEIKVLAGPLWIVADALFTVYEKDNVSQPLWDCKMTQGQIKHLRFINFGRESNDNRIDVIFDTADQK